jgi:outer membrane protein
MHNTDASFHGNRRAAITAAVLLVSLWTALPWGPAQALPAQERVQAPSLQNSALMSPIERAEKDGTALRISLRDLTKLALQNNLDIAISETNESVVQQKIIQAAGYYDPTLNVTLQTSRTKSANTNITNRSATGFNQRDSALWNASMTQYIPTGGGFTVTLNSNRSDTNQLATLFTPQFQGSTSVSFTQPLWRNRRIDSARSSLKLINLDLKTNDSKFKQGVSSTIAAIQALYWDLVGAIRNFEIKRQSVDLARLQVEQNKAKVDIGTLASITVTEAQATQATREIDLIQAKEIIQTTENALRTMISTDRNAEIWHQTIVPTDAPDLQEYPIQLDKAIQTALANRPELEQYNLQMQQNDITSQLQSNLKKWQFDAVGSFGAGGTAGPQSYTNGIPNVQQQFVGGLFNAYKTIFTEGLLNWSVGFTIQIPLKNRSLDAQLAQTQIAKQQLIMNRTKTEQSIIVQVRNAVEVLETSRQRVETAKVSLRLAEEQLAGETERFQQGMSQNFQVLQRQADLSAARGTQLQALISYKKAIITLQQSMDNLLEANDIEIAKSGKTAPAVK